MNNLRSKINSALLCTGTYAGNLALWNSLALNGDTENAVAYAAAGFIGSSYLLTKKFLMPSMNWLYNKEPGTKKNIGTSVLTGLTTLAIMNMAGISCERKAYASSEFRIPIEKKIKPINLNEQTEEKNLENLVNIRVEFETEDIREIFDIETENYEQKISSEYRALLETISWAEGKTDYDTLYGGNKFTNFSTHPNQKIKRWGLTSSAAGKYQFTHRTFKYLRDERDLFQDGFTPEAQDEAALYLIKKRGVDEKSLDLAIQTGNFNHIWDKLARTWASLPTKEGGSFYGQGSKSKKKLKEKFMEFYEH